MKTKYEIRIKKSVEKDFRKLPQAIIDRLKKEILGLATNPYPVTAKKLRGYSSIYRLRVNTYRIIYEVKDTIEIIIVVKVGHRKDVYRGY